MVLSYSDTRRLLELVGKDAIMRETVSRLRQGLAEVAGGKRQKCPPRSGFVIGDDAGEGVIVNMPYRQDREGMTLKTISYKPLNNSTNWLPTVVGALNRYSDETGELAAICDATIPTAIRTGATTAIASSLLARPGAHAVALVGAGLQSVTQLHGLSIAFDMDVVRVYDINAVRAQSLRERCAFTHARFEVADNPQTAVDGADILVTATSVRPGAGPVVRDEHLAEHLHINSIGSDEPGKTELPRSILERAFVCVDHIEQALAEGECQVLDPHQIDAVLEDLVFDAACHERQLPQTEQLTVFDSTGFAFADHVVFDVFLDYAMEAGIGQKLSMLDDAVDLDSPYSRLR
jgi:ornithine cyclodeaminase/alanine dehydrogenase-like protein (mu-crystallin family)